MTKNNIWVISSTFPNADEAFSVAGELVEKKLIACATISAPMMSIYRWQGGIQRESEVTMTAKTSQEKVSVAIETLAALHSYQLPAVSAWPVEKGFEPFLQWVVDETTDKPANDNKDISG